MKGQLDFERDVLYPIIYGIFGVVISVPFFTFAYLLSLRILEFSNLTFLHSPSNFGQFEFFVIYLGVFGFFAGCTVWVVYFFGRTVWLFVYFIVCVVFFFLNQEIWHSFDVTETTFAALSIHLVIYAILIGFIPRRKSRISDVHAPRQR